MSRVGGNLKTHNRYRHGSIDFAGFDNSTVLGSVLYKIATKTDDACSLLPLSCQILLLVSK